MKPIIIKTDKDGNIKITEEELAKIVDDAYNAGFKDGSRVISPTITSPTWPPYNPYEDNPYLYKITCDPYKVTLKDGSTTATNSVQHHVNVKD